MAMSVPDMRGMSVPDMPWRIMAGLCVPEKPIVLAQTETCWPNPGPGAGVAADATPADSKSVPAARVVVARMRTEFMIGALRGDECASSNRRTDVGGFVSRRDPAASSTLTPRSIGSCEGLWRNDEESPAHPVVRVAAARFSAVTPTMAGGAGSH